jgi:hypothetical protein
MGVVYFVSGDGVVTAIEAADTLKVLARNDLGETVSQHGDLRKEYLRADGETPLSLRRVAACHCLRVKQRVRNVVLALFFRRVVRSSIKRLLTIA